jgi:biotin operon repressor
MQSIQLLTENQKQIQGLLKDRTYLHAKEIAEVVEVPITRVYSAIKQMRIRGIGVMTVNKGYVLSNKATKRDDINFTRRLYGRRASDLLAVMVCKDDIQKRWNTPRDRAMLQKITSPLLVNLSNSKGMQVLLTIEKELKD